MLRALWFALQIGLIAVAAYWVLQRPGAIDLHWLGYEIHAEVEFVFLCLLIFVLVLLAFHRAVLAFLSIPAHLKRRREKLLHKKGYRALLRGLAAVAAGDVRTARDQAGQTRKFWPDDNGLSLLLTAQAARLADDRSGAEDSFKKLMKNKDAAFLGLRGLIAAAREDGENGKALDYARQALLLHPRQKWLLQTTYALELTTRNWDDAEKTLKRAIRAGAIDGERAKSDRIAMLLYRAENLPDHDDAAGQAQKLLTAANRLDPAHIPAALHFARYQIKHGHKRKAASVIEAAWKKNPHPELAQLWGDLAPDNKPADPAARLRWFEKLVALRPDSAESQLAAAKAALEDGLWGETRQYLNMAEQIGESARLCRLSAKLAERQGRPAEAALWLERAADAPAGQVWYCTQTGRIYEHWSPIALPHGAFNTIKWGYPSAAQDALPAPAAEEQRVLG